MKIHKKISQTDAVPALISHISAYRCSRGLLVFTIVSLTLLLTSVTGFGAGIIDDVKRVAESSRPQKIVETMQQNRDGLQAKTVRLLTNTSGYRRGFGGQSEDEQPVPDFRGSQKSEFVLSVDRLYYESPDLHQKRWPLRKVAYDGTKQQQFEFSNETKVVSVDIYCNRPLMHEVLIPFVEGTGLSCFADQSGRLEMEEIFGRFLECEWKGVEQHSQLGEVMTLTKKNVLLAGIGEQNFYFGERHEQLVYLGTEDVSLSNGKNHPEGLIERTLFSVQIDYGNETGYVLPKEWNRVRSTVVGELEELDGGTPIINSAVRTVVTKCEVLDSFPERYFDIKIQKETRVTDHCDLTAPVAAVIEETGGYGIWFILAGVAVVGVVLTRYLVVRRQRVSS